MLLAHPLKNVSWRVKYACCLLPQHPTRHVVCREGFQVGPTCLGQELTMSLAGSSTTVKRQKPNAASYYH